MAGFYGAADKDLEAVLLKPASPCQASRFGFNRSPEVSL